MRQFKTILLAILLAVGCTRPAGSPTVATSGLSAQSSLGSSADSKVAATQLTDGALSKAAKTLAEKLGSSDKAATSILAATEVLRLVTSQALLEVTTGLVLTGAGPGLAPAAFGAGGVAALSGIAGGRTHCFQVVDPFGIPQDFTCPLASAPNAFFPYPGTLCVFFPATENGGEVSLTGCQAPGTDFSARFSYDASKLVAINETESPITFRGTLSGDGEFYVYSTGEPTPQGTEGLQVSHRGPGQVMLLHRNTGIRAVVSISASGAPADRLAHSPAVSAGGRFVAFVSQAANLVPGTPPASQQIFLKDVKTGAISRVFGRNLPGDVSYSIAGKLSVSADGERVGFSVIDSPTAGTSGTHTSRAYVWRGAGSPLLLLKDPVSSGIDPLEGDDPVLSANGSFVAYRSHGQIFRMATSGGSPQLASSPDGSTRGSPGTAIGHAISEDGSLVAFISTGTNLVAGQTLPAGRRAFVKDLTTGAVTVASAEPASTSHPVSPTRVALSGDGRVIALISSDKQTYRKILDTGVVTRVSSPDGEAPANGETESPGISQNGSVVTFSSGATNLTPAAPGRRTFVQEFEGDTKKGPLSSLDTQGGSTLARDSFRLSSQTTSADGSLVAYSVKVGNSETINVRNLSTGKTRVASVSADGTPVEGLFIYNGNGTGMLSSDGRYLGFSAYAGGTLAVYRKDLIEGHLEPIHPNADHPAVMSPDGSTFAFVSEGVAKFKKTGQALKAVPNMVEPYVTGLSSDGRYLALRTSTTTKFELRRADLSPATPTTKILTTLAQNQATFWALNISGNGRYITLIKGPYATAAVFRVDAGTNPATVEPVAEGVPIATEVGGPISHDGNLVAFAARTPNLGVQSYRKNMTTGVLDVASSVVGVSPPITSSVNGMSSDGRSLILAAGSTPIPGLFAALVRLILP